MKTARHTSRIETFEPRSAPALADGLNRVVATGGKRHFTRCFQVGKTHAFVCVLLALALNSAFSATASYYEDFNDGSSEFGDPPPFHHAGGKYVCELTFQGGTSYDVVSYVPVVNMASLRSGFKLAVTATPSLTAPFVDQRNISFGLNYLSPNSRAHYRGEFQWYARDVQGNFSPPYARIRITGRNNTAISAVVPTGISNGSGSTVSMTLEGVYLSGNVLRLRFTVSNGTTSTSVEATDTPGFTDGGNYVGIFSTGIAQCCPATPHIAFDDFSLVAEPPYPLPKNLVPALEPDGTFSITGTGIANMTYHIEASEDFQNWIPVGDSSADASGGLLFRDLAAPSFTHRFYRFLFP